MYKLFQPHLHRFKASKRWVAEFKAAGLPLDVRGVAAYCGARCLSIGDKLGYMVAAEEFSLLKGGNKTVFFENESLINSLFSANFDLSKGAGIDMPFDVFSVPMPKGFTLDGVPIPPFMVHYRSFDERREAELPEFEEIVGETVMPDFFSKPTEKQLAVTFNTPDNAVIRTTIRLEQLPALLKSKTGREFVQSIKESAYLSDEPLWDTEGVELEQQFAVVKLAVAIGVYHSATGKLREGFPNVKVKLPKGVSLANSSNSTLGSVFKRGVSKNSGHYVPPFFRNLKAEIYYQGEHFHKERGTRWVLVSDHVRGEGSVSPFTQES